MKEVKSFQEEVEQVATRTDYVHTRQSVPHFVYSSFSQQCDPDSGYLKEIRELEERKIDFS